MKPITLTPAQLDAALGIAPVCSSCHEPDPTTKHREFTGGPDGDLCDQCVDDYLDGQRESPQF